MIPHSIRLRLQLWHGVLLLGVLIGFGITAYRVAREDRWRQVDRELEQQMASAFRGPGRFPPPPPPPGMPSMRPFPGERPMPPPDGMRSVVIEQLRKLSEEPGHRYYYVLIESDGRELLRTSLAPGGSTFPAGAISGSRWSSGNREVFRMLPLRDALLVGRSVQEEEAELRRLAFSLIGAGAVLLGAGLIGGWMLATRALRPIRVISDTAEQIASGDMSRRISVDEKESELGSLAQTLNRTFEELEKSFARQAQFTSDAAHELRTPIAVLLTQVQLALSRPRQAEEYKTTLEACQRAAKRMRSLTEGMLALSRAESVQRKGSVETISLAAVCVEAVDGLRPMAESKGIEMLVEGEAAAPADPQQLVQVVTNLIQNAIHASDSGRAIQVTVSIDADEALVTVADQGSGIAAEELPRIFDRFYRADKSRTNPNGRSGLGLAICRAIVEGHSGRIEVHSELGRGSKFTVRLPIT